MVRVVRGGPMVRERRAGIGVGPRCRAAVPLSRGARATRMGRLIGDEGGGRGKGYGRAPRIPTKKSGPDLSPGRAVWSKTGNLAIGPTREGVSYCAYTFTRPVAVPP